MKKIIFALFSLALVASLAMIGCTQRDNPAIPETAGGGTITQHTHQYDGLRTLRDPVRSAFSSRWIVAYLPDGYKLDVVGPRFPVLYLLPGWDGEPSFYYRYGNENYYLASAIRDIADQLIANGEIKPMIILMPDASIPYGGSFYGNSSLEGPWEDMMAEELVTHAEEFFLTLGGEFGKESRAISGHASGGYGAMRIAMQYPDMFNSVSAIDAPLALAGDGDFGGVRELFDDYLDESGINSEASYYATDTLGFGNQPFKALMYSMAATYSSLLEPAGSSKFENLRITLPFDYTGTLDPAVWSQWMANDLYSWLDQTSYQEALDGQNIYFETSDHDVNFFNQQTLLFQQKLTSLGIAFESATFTGYEGYDAQSRSFLYDRIGNILKFHNGYLKNRFGEY